MSLAISMVLSQDNLFIRIRLIILNVHVKKLETNHIREIKNQEGTDIYLSGGGQFAGWLLKNELIDILKIKLNPLILGKGVRLFGNSTKEVKTIFLSTENFDDSMQIMSFKIKY